MASVPSSRRAESRAAKRMLVRLWDPKSRKFEITPTVDISCHGAGVVSKRSWQPNEELFVQSIRGSLYSQGRVTHHRSLTQDSYLMGLHLYHPTQHWTTSGNLQKLSENENATLSKRSANPEEVLKELCSLLEEYSPTWYTEKQRERALAALRLPTQVLLELVELLEEYSPTWCTEKQYSRALAALRVLGLAKVT